MVEKSKVGDAGDSPCRRVQRKELPVVMTPDPGKRCRVDQGHDQPQGTDEQVPRSAQDPPSYGVPCAREASIGEKTEFEKMSCAVLACMGGARPSNGKHEQGQKKREVGLPTSRPAGSNASWASWASAAPSQPLAKILGSLPAPICFCTADPRKRPSNMWQ